MAPSTGTLQHQSEISIRGLESCAVSRSMLISAVTDKGLGLVLALVRAIAGFAMVWFIGEQIVVLPEVNFYAACSASLVLIYFANLADVKSLRDAVFCLAPSILVLSLLAFDINAGLVGVCLLTELLLAFFAGFSRISGTLKDLGLWPYLFGANLMLLINYVDQFFI